jgi:hypothetical protein
VTASSAPLISSDVCFPLFGMGEGEGKGRREEVELIIMG